MMTFARQMELRERLAALEHEQWVHWIEYMLAHLNDANIARWNRQIGTSYEDLSEEEKDSDREWADKILKLIEEFWEEEDI